MALRRVAEPDCGGCAALDQPPQVLRLRRRLWSVGQWPFAQWLSRTCRAVSMPHVQRRLRRVAQSVGKHPGCGRVEHRLRFLDSHKRPSALAVRLE